MHYFLYSYLKSKKTNQLAGACGVFIDDDQTIVVADTGNHCIVEWKRNESTGRNGTNRDFPTDLAFDRENNHYVADSWNFRIKNFALISNSTFRFSNEKLMFVFGCIFFIQLSFTIRNEG